MWLYWWKPLIVSHHLASFNGQTPCGVCRCVLCEMGQPVGSSIIKLFFLSTAVLFIHKYPTTQNQENKKSRKQSWPETKKERKKHQEKLLERSGAAVNLYYVFNLSSDHMFRRLCEFMFGSPLLQLTTLPDLMAMYLNHHMTL